MKNMIRCFSGIQVINILHVAFTLVDPKSVKNYN